LLAFRASPGKACVDAVDRATALEFSEYSGHPEHGLT
jgi:hypothetical protein